MKNRELRRERQKSAQREFKKPVTPFQEINLEAVSFTPKGMTRAYRNTRYTVMIYDDSPTSLGPAIIAMIQRHDNKPIPGHWKQIQNIKNEIFGSETMGVEYYPPESSLIDRENIYWLWIFPHGVLPIPTL